MIVVRYVELAAVLALVCVLQAPPACTLITSTLARPASTIGGGGGAVAIYMRQGHIFSMMGRTSSMRSLASVSFARSEEQSVVSMIGRSRSGWMLQWDDSKLWSSGVSSEGENSAEESVKEDAEKADAEKGDAEKVNEVEGGGKNDATSLEAATASAVSQEDTEESSSDSTSKATSSIPPFIWPFISSSPKPKQPSTTIVVAKPETFVVVTGATGRVGQLTVRRVLELYPNVVVRALVNDLSKGREVLKEEQDEFGVKLEIAYADLRNKRSVERVVSGALAVLFCESGFAQNDSPWQRIANAVRLVLNPNSVTDVEGVKEVALALKAGNTTPARPSEDEAKTDDSSTKDDLMLSPLLPGSPRFVLLSSAAVTRPGWSAEEKAKYSMAAEVPIVKLNPLNILNVKAAGEKELRDSGVPYAVLRPCALNDEHPRGRAIFSVGDLAAGRICREDVADILARCLSTPEATGKTFEVLTIPGMDKVAGSPAKASIGQALGNLPTDETLDGDGTLMESIRQATYPLITQLRPVPLAIAAKQAGKAKD